jgi:hypothetical protein
MRYETVFPGQKDVEALTELPQIGNKDGLSRRNLANTVFGRN